MTSTPPFSGPVEQEDGPEAGGVFLGAGVLETAAAEGRFLESAANSGGPSGGQKSEGVFSAPPVVGLEPGRTVDLGFLGGCFGSDLLPWMNVGGGSSGLPVSMTALLLGFLQLRLIWPFSPQLKHLTDSVDRKTR